ncbi:MAG TPA: hypothetical protein PK718_06575 [Candidatus Methanofastidiosa archaeon]|nr:hypothetical protein [Candidatus Methanofastidiosa archaeon]
MEEKCLGFGDLQGDVFPYILFLPKDRKRLVSMLNGVFGSEAKIEILKRIPACGDIRIYQKNLIEELPYSNKTVIKNLKELCEFNILHENMEKQRGEKDVWVKYYLLDEKMTWLVLLFKEPSELNNMESIIRQLTRLYYGSVVQLGEMYGITEDEIRKEIF